MKMALVKVALATGAGLAMLAACGSANDGYDPTIPTAIELVGGSGQTARVGAPVDDPLTIRTANFVGDPVGGVSVDWYVVSGNGRISAGTTVTDENGQAQVSWILGPIAGQQKVQAVSSLTGSPVTFIAAALPDNGGGGGGGEEETPLIRR
jgi:hypothetical protein